MKNGTEREVRNKAATGDHDLENTGKESTLDGGLTGKEMTQKVKEIFRDIVFTSRLEQGAVKKTVNSLLRRVLRERCVMFHLTEVRSLDSYMFTHSVNVCLLSLILGLCLRLKRDQMKDLGVAALLHDVGRTHIPENILYKPGPLSAEEFREIKNHTVYGYESLRKCNKIPEHIALTALQHHERLDGSGYPMGLKGDEIGLFPRIVAVADVFDALLANRPFRKAFFPHQAVDIIVKSSGQYDSEILEVFIENVAIYPIGSVVLLNNDETGIVVDMNRGQQTRPVVRIRYDTEGRKLQFIRETDLSKSPDIYITRVIGKEQVEHD